MALVSINELMGRSFHIPSYQRGYRWGRTEVEALLNDLKEFIESDPGKNEFYCLQPIVLSKNLEGLDELLDGQQRLTTLYLLLSYLEEARNTLGFDEQLFSLTYATRPDSERFLKEGRFKTHTKENIDYYYMSEAYGCIDEWFKSENRGRLKGKFATVLSQTKDVEANVRVIEYVLKDDSKPIEVFLRLNQGKIPLTDAELVKALLLQKDKFLSGEKEDKKEVNMEAIQAQLDLIAGEWYEIECALTERDRWAFIAPKIDDTVATRIDLMLELTAKLYLAECGAEGLPQVFEKNAGYQYPCYVLFSEIIKQHLDDRIACVKEIWERVRSIYEFIDEWYKDHTLYHYIGFLLSEGVVLLESLLAAAMQKGRKEFKIFLHQKIGGALGGEPDKLEYDEINHRGNIRRLLFLHSVMCLENEARRFPFAAYREQKWSLEHITPQDPEPPTTPEAWKEWAGSHLVSLQNRETAQVGKQEKEELSALIKTLQDLKEKLEKWETEGRGKKEQFTELLAELESLFETVLKHESKLPDSKLHSLGNLCLLDKATNTSLSNNSFDVKREKIRCGGLGYIPPATRKVFVKGYSVYPQNNYFWDEADAAAYFQDIQNTYNQFKQQEK